MADVLQQGAAWLAAKMASHAGRLVYYRRGGLRVPITATVGRTLMKVADTFGNVQMAWTDRDYLFSPDGLFAELFEEPRQGDVIEDAEGGTLPGGTLASLYEVLAPGGEPPWRWSDPRHVMIRVHVKQTGKE